MITKKYLEFMSSMERGIRGADNLPDAIANNLDKQWNDIGDINGDMPVLRHTCVRCCRDALSEYPRFSGKMRETVPIVTLEKHKFVFPGVFTWVYFGQCDKCNTVYWATAHATRHDMKLYG